MPISLGPERSGRILASVTGEPTGQSGIAATPVDRTGASITFTVTDRPVVVEFHEPFITSATLPATAAVSLVDASGATIAALKGGSWTGGLTTTTTMVPRCVGIITTPGTYTVKAVVYRTAGTGTITVGLGALGAQWYYAFTATES